MSNIVHSSHDPLGLVDYGDTDTEEPGEEEVNLENGNILVNIMNNNVQEIGNHNKNVTTPVTFRRTDRDMSQSPEERNRRMSASCFMLPFTSGEDNNSNGSGSSEHECESSCEISTNDEDEGISRYQEHEHASSSFSAIHWLSRSGSSGFGVINKDADVKASCKGLDIFDDNAKDGCDDEETNTPFTVNADQTDEFKSFTKSKRSKLKNNEEQDFDLRTVLGNRREMENIPADFNMSHSVSAATAEEADSVKEIEELRNKIEVDKEQLEELTREKRDNLMNLATTARKKRELEDQLSKLSQKHKSINDKRIEIDSNIAFTEQEISKDTDHLHRMLRSHENLDTENGADADNAFMSVTVRNSPEPRGVPLVDSVRNINIDERISTLRDLGPIFSQNVNVNFISNPSPKQFGWKTMDENYFLNNSGPDFFDYLNQQGVTVHPKEIYKCRLCSVNVHGKKTLWSHLRGKKHGANMCDDSHDPDDDFGYEEILQGRYEEDKAPSSFSSDLRYLLKRKRESV